jgi:Flp pilus assembly protein TadB
MPDSRVVLDDSTEEVRKMFTHSPAFIRFQRYGQRFTGNALSGAWWVLMAPGIALTLVALAILVWPELLAYMVASLLLFVGITLMVWSWRMRRVERRMHQEMTTIDRDNW